MQSSVYSTDISNNSNYSAYVGGDRVFTRNITISGIVQNDWLKQPQRYVEQAVPILSTSPAGSTDPVVDFFNGPLNIVSN